MLTKNRHLQMFPIIGKLGYMTLHFTMLFFIAIADLKTIQLV